MINEFVQSFCHHLQEQSIDDAFDFVLQEAEQAGLDEDQIIDVSDKLVKANVLMFADHYMDYPELYESENPYAVLEYYCRNN